MGWFCIAGVVIGVIAMIMRARSNVAARGDKLTFGNVVEQVNANIAADKVAKQEAKTAAKIARYNRRHAGRIAREQARRGDAQG